MHLQEIKDKSPQDLFAYAEELGIEAASNQRRQELIFSVLLSLAQKEETITGSGVLEKMSDGFGYLRSADSNFLASADDIYVPARLIAAHSLRTGDLVEGELVAPSNSERYFSILNIEKVNTDVPDKAEHRMHFDNLTPLFPDRKIKLESDKPTKSITCRVIDMITPLGFGQRALIVAPPRTGKTILMQEIAHAITDNHPDVYLMVLLVDERPEEVTDMKRSVRGEVVASTFDEPADRHVKVADMVLARAKRMVECKKDVIVLLDSITRLARAYNTVQPSSGKVLTGGVDANALQKPKRFFGAARNIEQGGSLTIIATALVETGSRMDEVIFEEFKGTGNSEVILDRKLSDKRTFPSIDITRSGTRKEELLLGAEGLSKVWVLRRILSTMGTVEAMEFLRGKMKNTKTNVEFFDLMNQ